MPLLQILLILLGVSSVALVPLFYFEKNKQLCSSKINYTLNQNVMFDMMKMMGKNTIAILPKTVGGLSVEYIVLDDASDSSGDMGEGAWRRMFLNMA